MQDESWTHPVLGDQVQCDVRTGQSEGNLADDP